MYRIALLLLAPALLWAQPEATRGQRFAVSQPIFSFGKNLKFAEMETDPEGNLYLLGFHRAKLRLGEDTISAPYDGAQTSFLMKMDAAGQLLWQRQLTMGDMKALAYRDGFLYVGGEIATAEYGPLKLQQNAAGTTQTLLGQGNRDAFVAKYNAGGELLWARRFGGPDSEDLSKGDHLNDLAVDSQGRIYVCGSYNRRFQLSANWVLEKASDRGKTFYLAALDEAGNALWATELDSPLPTDGGNAEGLSLTLNAEEAPAVAVAYSAGGLLLDGEILLNDNQNGDQGALLLQYDAAGNWQWHLNVEPQEGLILPFGLEAGPEGSLYLAFSHEQQVLMGESRELQYFQEEDGLLKTGLAKVGESGNLDWGHTYFFSDADLDLHLEDGLFLIGAAFRPEVQFPGGSSLSFEGAGSTSLWARIRTDGTLGWAGKPEPVGAAPFSTNHSICADADGATYLSANFNRSLQFAPDIVLDNGYNSPDFDALYLVKLASTEVRAAAGPAVQPLRLFPNPSAGDVSVHLPSTLSLELRNAQGQLLWRQQLPAGHQQLSLAPVPSGVYWLLGYGEQAVYRARLLLR